MTYEQIIQEINKAKGETPYRTLAANCGVSPATIYRTLNAKYMPNAENLIKIASSVGLKLTLTK